MVKHHDTGVIRKLSQGSLSGPNSAAFKYDVLTALLVLASQGAGGSARLALRLSLVITARYSWRRKIFAVGQRELGQMWGVSERTAKRELAAMRSIGWICVERPSARGRVAEYRINFDTVLIATAAHWAAVGPDYEARMQETPEQPESNVVPLRASAVSQPVEDGSVWPAIARRLQEQDPAVYNAWMSQLVYVGCENNVLVLAAPSRFAAQFVMTHYRRRLISNCVQTDPAIRDVQIICQDL